MSEYIKEWLTINDIMQEMSVSYGKAAEIIRAIKRKFHRIGDPTDVQGRLHIQDYINYFNLPIERYLKKGEQK